MPAEAGIHYSVGFFVRFSSASSKFCTLENSSLVKEIFQLQLPWMPAFAGMTDISTDHA